MTISRDEFLKPRRPPFEVVEIPELGGSVVVQGMTVAMRDRFMKKNGEDRALPPEQQVGYNTLLLLWSLAGEDGQLLFKIEDAPLVGQLPAAITDRLSLAAERVSGLTVKLPAPTPAPTETTPKN